MEKPRLLIVDDDETIRSQMKWALSGEYDLFLAGDRPTALQIVKDQHPSLVVLDLGLPPAPHSIDEGLAALQQILMEDGSTKVIIATGNTEKEHALKAIAQGAHDFFSKPIDLEEMKITLRRSLRLHLLEKENRELHLRLSQQGFPEIVGSSPEMEEIFSNIRKIATTNIPVLIMGETGTGKELVARAIHDHSERCREPFVVINCAAIPESLLESELFGFEKGAFTGAESQRKGRFEKAHKGTLFLDEIGELGIGLQTKLLRFLQEHKIERIGGRQLIDLDVRVLAATNRNLKEAVSSGGFRDDLYFRLAVVTLEIPPLRNRGKDLQLIATAMLKQFSRELSRSIKGFTPEAIELMKRYSWPGNVRELENKVKRAVIMAEGPFIEPRHLEIPITAAEPKLHATLKEVRDEVERDLVSRTLIQHGWNVTQAAKQLGLSRQALHDIIAKHKLKG